MLNNVFLLLFVEYVKIGLFTFGGGYASLPFLYQLAQAHNWFSLSELTQMIAISGITPGPVGLNMATFAGFKCSGILGALVASFALVLPMIIVTGLVFKFYLKFSQSECTKSVLYVLRPTSCALICAVGAKLFYDLVLNKGFTLQNIDLFALILLIILFVLTFVLKRDPLIYIAISAVAGIIIKLC